MSNLKLIPPDIKARIILTMLLLLFLHSLMETLDIKLINWASTVKVVLIIVVEFMITIIIIVNNC